MAKSTNPKRTGSSFSSLSDDTDDTEYHLVLKDGERLVSCLPGITHFAVVLPQIYPLLLQACLVETNLNCLQHYMLFLTQNYPHDKLYESVVGISRLIVDRFDIIKKILSPSSSQQFEIARTPGSYSLILLGSLLEMFRSAMEATLHSQAMLQLSSNAEVLLVAFPTVSQKAILHTAFIQAVFLLLSHDPPSGVASSDFSYLLDLWLPVQPQNRPEACTIDSKEKQSIPPKEVLHFTLLSTNTRVLEASVQTAKPSVLCRFVQQFGCPVVSVDKALEVLDDLCSDHSVAAELRHLVLDPAAVGRSVEIQMHRGIKHGKHFLTFVRGLANISLVDSGQSAITDVDYRIGRSNSILKHYKTDVIQKVPSKHSAELSQHFKKMSVDGAEQQLLNIFCPATLEGSSETKRVLDKSIKHLLLLHESDVHLTSLITALHQLLSKASSLKKIQFLEGMVKNRFSLALLRMITKLHERRRLGSHLSNLFQGILRHICVLLSLSMHKIGTLKLYPSFVAVLKVCCKSLGVVFNLERKQMEDVISSACKEIELRRNPFENESTLIKLSCDVIQNASFRFLETLCSTLIMRSLDLNMETKCIRTLLNIRTAVENSTAPIALQCNSELFSAGKNMLDSSAVSKSSGKDFEVMETGLSALPCCPDLNGLLVDMFELLDPEIISLSPTTSMKVLFGHSEAFKCLDSVSSRASSSSRGLNSSLVANNNMLLSGQGYLLARLVNSTSWCSLLGAIRHVLDKCTVQEW